MSSEELLRLARRGELDTLAADLVALADAVRSFAAAGDARSALELFGRTWRAWSVRGEWDDGIAVASLALAAPGGGSVSVWRARALYADGVFAFRTGDRNRSLERNQEALNLARETDDVRGECDALTGLARVALRDGRLDDVISLARQALERAQTVGDREAEAPPLHLHAAGVRLCHDYAAARNLYLKSLDLNAALHNRAWVAMEQHNLGWVELHLGNVDAAADWFRQRDADGAIDAYADAWRELNWAAVAMARGEIDEADARFCAGKQSLEKLGVALDPDDQSELDWLTQELADRRS